MLEAVSSKVPGAGLTDLEARTPEPFSYLRCQVTSGRAPDRIFPALRFPAWEFRPIPVRRNLVLGIAKLLPQIVPVKRETLQVVSLTMTGLMRGYVPDFHIVEIRGRPRFVLSRPRLPFWDRISRQGLRLPRENDD
jgi:hypothetical protein